MRIAWVTPMARRSAIGRFSVPVAEALHRRGHRVRIVRCESDPDPAEPIHDTHLPVDLVDRLDPEAFRARTDIAVINVGDNYLFHGGIFRMLEIMPCAGVFHDFYLMNLFNGWAAARGATANDYENAIVETYGPQAREMAGRARTGELPLATIAANLPMTEWVARRCAGALAHAQFYTPRLAAACAGPVDFAHLTMEARDVDPLPPRDRKEVVIATVGVMNPNKCADAVIEAIGDSPLLRERAAYRLIGPISDDERARLTALAQAQGFTGLTIFGAVDDETLADQLEDADVICCLRKPVLEGASASAVEALLSGRPTIVADAGFYGEIPDAYALKVPADVPPAALAVELERLVGDEALRRQTGAKAQAWAKDHFSLDRYVDKAEALIRETVDALPILEIGAALGHELAGFGLGPDDPAVARIASLVETMFPRARL